MASVNVPVPLVVHAIVPFVAVANAVYELPEQTVADNGPASDVGVGVMINVKSSAAGVHGAFDTVIVRVTLPAKISAGLGV